MSVAILQNLLLEFRENFFAQIFLNIIYIC